MGRRMRVRGWQVMPVIVADDDETGDLTDVPVQSAFIPRADWAAFKAGGDDAALESVRLQVEHSTPGPGRRADMANNAVQRTVGSSPIQLWEHLCRRKHADRQPEHVGAASVLGDRRGGGC
jgi:hypothetical protein